MKQNLDLGREKISRLFISYSIPSVISILGMSTFSIIDGIIVGQLIGHQALATVNLAMPYLFLSWALGAMVASGGFAQTTIELGRENIDLARSKFTMAATLIGIIYLVFVIIALVFGDQIAIWSGSSPELAPDVSIYIKIIAVFSIFWIGSIYLDMGVRSMGNPRLSMIVILLASFLNIVFDLLFVGVFHWGIKGAALASGMGFILAFLVLLRQYFLPEAKLRFQRFRPHPPTILRIFANGSSEALTNLSLGITTLLFNLVLMARIGDLGVAAFAIVFYLHDILLASVIGISSAILPIISYNFGAGHGSRVTQTLKLSLAIVFIIGVLTISLIYLATPQLAMLFNRQPDLVALTVQAFRWFAPCYLFIGINIIGSAYFTALGDAVRSAFIALDRSLLFVLLGLWLLPMALDINGIWFTVPFAELLTLLFSAPLMYSSSRRLNTIIPQSV